MKKMALILYYKILEGINVLVKIQNLIMLPFLKHPSIINTEASINYIIKNKCSVSRFGDGEFSLLNGTSIGFQKANKKLSAIFKEMLTTNTENHITCLPYALIDQSSYTKKAQVYWNNYLSYNRLKIYKHLNKNKTYYDALFTRLYMDAQDKDMAKEHFKSIKQVWNNQDIIIVEGEKSRLGIGNDLFSNAKSIKRIIGPSTNAFNVYNDMLNYINQHCSKNSLFLLALGPTATALAFDLYRQGYWAIDIGHIDIEYEWMLIKATKKISVKNKFVGDTMEFFEIKNELHQEYYSQIIYSIE